MSATIDRNKYIRIDRAVGLEANVHNAYGPKGRKYLLLEINLKEGVNIDHTV